MTDREKVIKGLECCLEKECKGGGCPYSEEGSKCDYLLYDALSLLKEKEEEHHDGN